MLKQKPTTLVADLYIDSNDMAFVPFEAPSAETVRVLLMQSGPAGFHDRNLHLVTSIPELLRKVGKVPTIYL